ncbi:MAG: DUF1156 domain-containing protein [Candidatus Omnitrophota bacterium]|nr:DUF1156 domain-containing protein [Candidatus Omnitrophota bacterium]
MEIKSPKKLIEVALPLDDINIAAVREKSIRHGHPSTLHLWWARRPLAAARAVIFAQMVNDPGYDRSLKSGLKKDAAQKERERLFQIIRDLVKWESTTDEEILERARVEIRRSWRETCELNKDHPQANELFNRDKLPAFHDPFAGGGAIPLEAQRLGLESYASDLNPVAVTINKAMIEIPPKFADFPPVGPLPSGDKQELFQKKWIGAKGLAEDVRRYGKWMQVEAYKRIGRLYPQLEIKREMIKERPDLINFVGKKFTVIAWLWTRTVKSPNPAYSHADVPLASTFVLSTKEGKEAYVEPIVEGNTYRFVVRMGKPKNIELIENGTKLARGANFRCLLSNSPIEQNYIRTEFKEKRSDARLMAVVVEGPKGRIYLSPTLEHEASAGEATPSGCPEMEMNQDSKDLLSGRGYGFKYWHELFSPRQLVALTTFSDLVQKTVLKIKKDAVSSGMEDDGKSLDNGGTGATAYAQAVGVYLAFGVDKCSDYWSSICSWHQSGEKMRNTFGRQAIPMVWDYAEANPFCESTGNWMAMIDWTWKALETTPAKQAGVAIQADAQSQSVSDLKVISTDPPYYDNIAYADLSDFFYIWIRRSLMQTFPNLYATMAVPKTEELIAAPYRHGSKEKAEAFFLDGMTRAVHNFAIKSHPAFPLTIYYAFKQSETTDEKGTSSTGWETFLEAVLRAGLAITGTWPMRTELSNRMIGSGTNALASSIVLVCRKRSVNAPTVSRRDFLKELNASLPEALIDMTRGEKNSPVAPVDLSQSIIGPGMAIFSQYSAVIEADGKLMSVKTALQLINRFLAEEDFDHDTQFCLHWFETFGWSENKFGEADVLARAKGTTVEGVRESGVIEAKAGKVRLLKFSEYPGDWNPATDKRIPVWETLHHLIRALRSDGESAAGFLLSRMITKSEATRQLAYRLYTLCERKGWADDARAYNELITSWEAIENASHAAENAEKQKDLFNTGEVNVA